MASYIDLNNLGSFASINALWAAYPEGGQEGDYCTIDGVKYRWDKYDRMWVADPNFGPTPARSVTTFDGDVNMQNNLTVAGYIRAKGIKQPCLGLFASLDALEAKWPEPEVGMWALVGNSMSSTSPAAVYRCDTEGTWAATGGSAYIDGLEINVAKGITGWVPISSTSQLPTDPTPDQQGRGYLLGTMLYVYVGTGGDTLSGKYKSAQLKGETGEQGPQGEDGVSLGEVAIADNLTTNDNEKVLSAKQGYMLKGLIDDLGTLDSESVGLDDVTIAIKFKLTQTLTNITSSTDATSVSMGSSLSVTLTPASGYSIYSAVVKMGGVDITSTAYSNNVVSISEVDGDVIITAVAAEVGVVPVVFADSNVEAIILANFPHENEGFITEGEALEITSLNGKFKGDTDITSFDELPKFGVTSLANEEFMGCSSLESIDISKISAMGNYCFSGCTALETINLGSSSVTELGRNTFYGCSSLESIDISKINSIGFASEGNAAGYDCFRGCSSLTSIKTNNNVTKVPNNCFRDCTALATIDLGSSVVTLGSNAATGAGYDTLVFRSTTPPNYDTSFVKAYATLYVPSAALDTYKGTSWNTYNGSGNRQLKTIEEDYETNS